MWTSYGVQWHQARHHIDRREVGFYRRTLNHEWRIRLRSGLPECVVHWHIIGALHFGEFIHLIEEYYSPVFVGIFQLLPCTCKQHRNRNWTRTPYRLLSMTLNWGARVI